MFHRTTILTAADGLSGPSTAAATWAFQRYAHLSIDGIVGPHTRNAMTAALPGFQH